MIKAENVTFEYDRLDEEGNIESKLTAVDHLSLKIESGSFIAVLGHNGSGKSTFAKHINALLTPTDGTLWVNGMDTKDEEHLWDIRQNAGMVFQNPDNQIIGTIVEEDVGFGPENLGVPTDEIWRRVDQSLEAVGMTAYRLKSPNKLSGGQKQRISIARALIRKPKIIIFDEATSALDSASEKKVQEATDHMMGKCTTFIVAHRLSTIRKADVILVVQDGRIIERGSHRALMDQKGAYYALYTRQYREQAMQAFLRGGEPA